MHTAEKPTKNREMLAQTTFVRQTILMAAFLTDELNRYWTCPVCAFISH
jgi:hypothetical protein